MLNLNLNTLDQVIAKAKTDAAQDARWVHAIERAAVELVENPWIERTSHGLLIASPSGQLYEANGVCQCTANGFGWPCWHRAAAKLVKNYDQAVTAQADRAARLMTMPEGDVLDADGMRVQRRLATERATALLNELFA